MYHKTSRPPSSIISNKEKQAATNLLARSEHLSPQVVTPSERWENNCRYSFGYPARDRGTTDSVSRQSYFQWLNAVYVNQKRTNFRNGPICINLYAHHLERGYICFSGYATGNSSVTKADVLLIPDTDRSFSHISLSALNGGGEHRLGSVLIQMVIEYSIHQGCEGRVSLRSTRDSGQFYFKLGFIPDNDIVYQELMAGQHTNGWDMYLPEASIAIWKEKIRKHPLLTRQIGKQWTDNIWLHSDDTEKLWPFLIDKLRFDAIQYLFFDYARYSTRQFYNAGENLIWAFKGNTSLESVSLKGSTFNWPLSELITALSFHPNLSCFTIRNYDETTNEMDDATFQALANFIKQIPRLQRLTFAHLRLFSDSFVIFCEALARTSGVKEIEFEHMTLSADNIRALKKALIWNSALTKISSSQCDANFEAMLVELRQHKMTARLSETQQTLFARKLPPSLQQAIITHDRSSQHRVTALV